MAQAIGAATLETRSSILDGCGFVESNTSDCYDFEQFEVHAHLWLQA